MIIPIVYLLCFVNVAFSTLHGRQVRSVRCDDSDSCGRAITGTRAHSLSSNTPLSDCSSFMTDIITIAPV